VFLSTSQRIEKDNQADDEIKEQILRAKIRKRFIDEGQKGFKKRPSKS
jgi:hypothetical protein